MSVTSASASSSPCSTTRSASRCKRAPRSANPIRGHGPSSKARRADATARSTSAWPPRAASAYAVRAQVTLLRELQRDVDQHVLLAADVAGLTRALEDLVGRHVVALGRVLGVQQERRVDAGPALHDRR